MQWGQWSHVNDGPFPRVAIDDTDLPWDSAERSGELGRQAAARWAGERLGIAARAHLWRVFHPTEPGPLEGEEVAVLIIPQHRDLQPQASGTVVYHPNEQQLPPKLLRQVDGIVDNKESKADRAASWRGAGWPKEKA